MGFSGLNEKVGSGTDMIFRHKFGLGQFGFGPGRVKNEHLGLCRPLLQNGAYDLGYLGPGWALVPQG